MSQSTIEAVRKRLEVGCSPERAFELFTTDLQTWWPLATHSCSGDPDAGITFEGRVGGRIVEHFPNGDEALWGTVLEWDPPRRFVSTWHPGHPDALATRLEVAFAPSSTPGGTVLELVHTGWEVHGDRGPELRKNYDVGWDAVLSALPVG